MKFESQFTSAHAVSTPLVNVRTFDAKSTVKTIESLSITYGNDGSKAIVNDKLAVIVWDCVQGLLGKNKLGTAKVIAAIQNAKTVQDTTIDLPIALRVASLIGEDAIIFVSNAHLFWAEPTVIQSIWNLRDPFKAWGSMLVLLSSTGAILPPELSNDFLVLDEPLPTIADLEKIVTDTFEYAKKAAPSTKVLTESTQALTGLPSFTAEQSTAMCLDATTGKFDMDGLWERKRQAINQTRGLSVLQTDANLDDIGGLNQFKQYLERVMTGKNPPNVILLWDEIEKAFAGMGTDTSGTTTKLGGNILTWSNDTEMRGMIAIGIPGSGKTQIAKAIANKYGKLCVSFSVPNMESALVGSSNEHLCTAIAMIDSISDKKVLSIATCNKIDSLSTELQRRFANEGIFFFDAPTTEERESIWKVYRTKYSIPDSDPIPNDNGWTGAEIKNCALKAYRLGITLQQASDYIIPVTVSGASTVDALRRLCSNKYLSASYPGRYIYNEHSGLVDGQEMALPEQSGRKMRG